MKHIEMETKPESLLCVAGHLISRAVCLGGNIGGGGNIFKFTPNAACKAPGVRRTKQKMSKQFAGDVHKSCLPRPAGAPCLAMFIKSLQIGFVGLVVSAASALAAPSMIQGTVKDSNGRPLKGADVRIESRDGSRLFKVVKTDANGRYISDGLSVGIYRVTLVVNGAVKASITNTKTKADGPTQLNFDLKATSASQASGSTKKGKHWVWVPPKTGTHTGGGWVEVDDSGSSAADAANVQQINGQQLQQQIHDTRSTKGP